MDTLGTNTTPHRSEQNVRSAAVGNVFILETKEGPQTGAWKGKQGWEGKQGGEGEIVEKREQNQGSLTGISFASACVECIVVGDLLFIGWPSLNCGPLLLLAVPF